MLVKRSGPVGCCRRRIICRHYCCAHQNRACNCHAQGGQCSGSSHYFLPRAKRRIVKRCTMLYKPSQVKVAIFVSILIKFCNFCCKGSGRCAPGVSMSPTFGILNEGGELSPRRSETSRHGSKGVPQGRRHVPIFKLAGQLCGAGKLGDERILAM